MNGVPPETASGPGLPTAHNDPTVADSALEAHGRARCEDLADSAWSETTEHGVTVTRSWTSKTLVSYLRTTSFAGADLLAERHAAFEDEARMLLVEFAAGGSLLEDAVFTVLLAPRPGGER